MKKEIIKPFDLASYKNGAKVKTRDGHDVRIICTDAKHIFYPIIALVKVDGDKECTISYTPEGKAYHGLTNNANDLVIVEEIEETEFWSDRENATITGYVINEYSSIEQRRIVTNDPACYNIFATEKHAKSARAMARISQIMANDIENFGGVITDEEWNDIDITKYVIYKESNNITIRSAISAYYFLAFHTNAQRSLFLKKYHYLVKEYLMLD